MDFSALQRLALFALSRVMNIAIQLGGETRIQGYGQLGCELSMLIREIRISGSYNKKELVRHKIRELLRAVEGSIAGPRSIVGHVYPVNAIATAAESDPVRIWAETRVRCGLKACFSAHSEQAYEFIALIRQFSKDIASIGAPELPSTLAGNPVDYFVDYLQFVNRRLYKALRNHASCTCIDPDIAESGPKRHLARLSLKPNFDFTDDNTIQFEMLFSAVPVRSSPKSTVHWQDMEIRVSSEKSVREPTQPADGGEPIPPNLECRQCINPGEFCRLIGAGSGSRLCVRAEDEELILLPESKPIGRKVVPTPGASLAAVLDQYSLTAKMKAGLAYILAKSVWQFYDSDWMNTAWTGKNIHFMHERSTSNGKVSNLYACKPCFPVRFDEVDTEFAEFCDLVGKVHRYPRVVALGIMLIEIGIGSPLSSGQPRQLDINADWTLGKNFFGNRRLWIDFDYPKYRLAVSNCLDPKLFAQAAVTPGQTSAERRITLEDRQRILYNRVVCPLEEVLTGTGWFGDLAMTEPLIPAGHLQTLPEASSLQTLPFPIGLGSGHSISKGHKLPDSALGTKSDDRKKSEKWLNRVRGITQRLLNTVQQKEATIKIAILDTGYDNEAAFFQLRERRMQLKGWRDWVEDIQTPQDCDGHGTHLVALVMKVAPTAHIFVGRVAKESQGLQEALKNIAEAIDWATKTCKADIISMSLGVPRGDQAIDNAIRAATLNREGSVLFFAAAGNDAANGPEMFPAKHNSVISIRATNSEGAFANSNPPRDPDGPIVYGTLGKEVPSACLRNGSDEVCRSGSSVATAIAAGIAAMVLGYASSRAASRIGEWQVLRTKEGMLKMFRKMSSPAAGLGCYYLAPWPIFDSDESVISAYIRTAVFEAAGR